MSFDYVLAASTTARPAAVWALWSAPARWSSWDPAVQSVTLDGDFVVGATGTIVLTGGLESPVRLDVVEPGARYLDVLDMGELCISVDHVVTATAGGAEIVVTTHITGPGAEDIGPMVTEDAPKALAALVALAEGR